MSSERQHARGPIADSAPAGLTTTTNKASSNMNDGGNATASTSPGGPTTHQNSARGKFTLTIDCDGLLMPDINRPGIYTSKSGGEVAQYFQLSTLLMVSTLYQIKIKCFHTCGQIEFDEGACLESLWRVGDWLVGQYRDIERSARYEKRTNGREGDWSDPDITLLVFID